MDAKGLVVQPGQGAVWNMSPGWALFLYTPGGAGRMFEEARRLQRPLSSMDDREVAEFFKRFGWDTVGPPPF